MFTIEISEKENIKSEMYPNLDIFPGKKVGIYRVTYDPEKWPRSLRFLLENFYDKLKTIKTNLQYGKVFEAPNMHIPS